MAIIEVQGWTTSTDPAKLYKTKGEAQRADGRERLQIELDGIIDWQQETIDIEQIIARGPEIISALIAAASKE